MGLLHRQRRRADVAEDPEDLAESVDSGTAPIDATLAAPRQSWLRSGGPWVWLSRGRGQERNRVVWHQGTALTTRAVHLALVAALASGPVALAVAALGTSRGTGVPRSAVSNSPGASTLQASRASAAGERVVLTWLTGTRTDEQALQAQLMTPLPPTFALPDTRPATPNQVWVDSAEELVAGRWQVVVGARGGAAGAQSFFAVPVVVSDVGAAALTLPARTNPPVAPDARIAPAQGFTSVTTEDPVYQSVAGYLAAYLAAGGELDRWIAPGVSVEPVQPRPCRTVKLDDVRASVDEVPAPDRNGLQLAVIATATCRAAAGTPTVSQYPLVLQVRDGRWEVAAGNPGLVTSPDPTASTTTPAPPAGPTTSSSEQPR